MIRRATSADSGAIAGIHVRAWQTAYGEILPADLIRSRTVELRERFWRETLERGTSQVWVAEDEGTVLGWISAGPSRDPDTSAEVGEVWALYVDPPHWRRGVGRRLWHQAQAHLIQSGFSEATLWVFKENNPALAFYASIGFAVEAGSEKTIERAGAELVEVRMRRRLD